MFKVCDYNFQLLRRNGLRSIPRRELSMYGEICLGDLAIQLNDALDSVVAYPSTAIGFSLINVAHHNKNSAGWCPVDIEVPGAVIVFHFMLDRNLQAWGRQRVTKDKILRSWPVRQRIILTDISAEFGNGRIMSIGFSAVDLKSNYEALIHTLGELELMYKILGMSTKAHRMYKGKWFNGSEHLGTVLASNRPEDYHKCAALWKRYPNLIPKLSVEAAEYTLANVQKYRKLKDRGNRAISQRQRALLGITVESNYVGSLVYWVLESVRQIIFNEPRTNKCIEICFDNFPSLAASVEDLAYQIWSIDEQASKQKIHDLIWSKP